jgi:hypothetical protein
MLKKMLCDFFSKRCAHAWASDRETRRSYKSCNEGGCIKGLKKLNTAYSLIIVKSILNLAIAFTACGIFAGIIID